MPTEMTGISIEPREAKIAGLFEVRDLALKEINRRGEQYLRSLGYKWDTIVGMDVSFTDRNQVSIVTISAHMKDYYDTLAVSLEVPLKQFEAVILPEKKIK